MASRTIYGSATVSGVVVGTVEIYFRLHITQDVLDVNLGNIGYNAFRSVHLPNDHILMLGTTSAPSKGVIYTRKLHVSKHVIDDFNQLFIEENAIFTCVNVGGQFVDGLTKLLTRDISFI